MNEKPIPAKFAVTESLERSKNAVCENEYESSKKKIVPVEIPMEKTKEIAIKATCEAEKTKNDKNKDDQAIPTKTPEENPKNKNIKLAETPEITKLQETKKESLKDIKNIKIETPTEISKITKLCEILKTESTKNVKDDKSAILTKDTKENYVKNIKPTTEAFKVIEVNVSEKKCSKDIKDDKFLIKTLENIEPLETLKTESTKCIKHDSLKISLQNFEENDVKEPAEDTKKTKKIPVLKKDFLNSWDLGARKIWRPMSAPNLDERPLVLAIHLSPSLPIELFEVFAEIIEVVTKKPVVLLYETRFGRPVAKDVTDIAILPAADDWNDGVLLPASFVFEHHLNKNNSPHVYADVIISDNHVARHVENIMDLRGHRCAISSRCNKICATSLLFNYLHIKGENPAFFGNILDGNSHLDVLKMVASKQAEVGILEAPVIRCHKLSIIGTEFLQILTSLGPLPPYRIMINKALVNTFGKKLTTYLLNINQHKEWMERLSSFGIVSFSENSPEFYNLNNIKSVATSVPYY